MPAHSEDNSEISGQLKPLYERLLMGNFKDFTETCKEAVWLFGDFCV